MSGSGLLTHKKAVKPHLMQGSGGIAAEVADLRADLEAALLPVVAVTVDEFTNPAAPAAAGLHAATATTVAVQTVLTAALEAAGKTALAAYPRNVTFTTAGDTPADAPANGVVTGTDINDDPLTETITVAQTATISQGAKCFKTITSIVFAPGDGTDATVAIGFGKKFGLSKPVKFRAGTTRPIQEIAAGAVVTTGTLANATTSPPNGSYSPSTDPDASNDYAVYYEYTPS